MSVELSDERKQQLKEKTDDVFTRVIGFVSFLIGTVAAIFVCWAGYLSLFVNVSSVAVVFLGVILLIASFFLNVGWRMLFNKTNRYGSILSPLSWIVVGIFFLTCFVVIMPSLENLSADSQNFVNTLISLVSCLGFSACCFYLAYVAYKKA